MDLIDALRGTGAVREFEDRPVDRAVVARVLDSARFAPNGGNQQSWRVVLVEDPQLRIGMRDLYVPGWLEYLEMRKAGVQPWAPIGDPDGEAAAAARAHELTGDAALEAAGGFAARFHEVPVMAVVLADLRLLAATDRDLGRYTLVGGASVYPFVWSILLAAHAEGLGGVVTTMTTTREPDVRRLLHIPDEFALCAVLALGHPVRFPKNLRRDPVDSFATVDTFDGPPVPNP
jgi:nitroreductase